MDLAQFFQRRGCGFQMQTWGVSSSPSDSTERVLNRSAAVFSVDRRCRSYFGRFATTLDLGLFQQNRPTATQCGAANRKAARGAPSMFLDALFVQAATVCTFRFLPAEQT